MTTLLLPALIVFALLFGGRQAFRGLFDPQQNLILTAGGGAAIGIGAVAVGALAGVFRPTNDLPVAFALLEGSILLTTLTLVCLAYGAIGLVYRRDRGLEPVGVAGAVLVGAIAIATAGADYGSVGKSAPSFGDVVHESVRSFLVAYGILFAIVGAASRDGRRLRSLAVGAALVLAGLAAWAIDQDWAMRGATRAPFDHMIFRAIAALLVATGLLMPAIELIAARGRVRRSLVIGGALLLAGGLAHLGLRMDLRHAAAFAPFAFWTTTGYVIANFLIVGGLLGGLTGGALLRGRRRRAVAAGFIAMCVGFIGGVVLTNSLRAAPLQSSAATMPDGNGSASGVLQPSTQQRPG